MSERKFAEVRPRDYYPNVTQNIISLFQEGRLTNIDSINVEQDYGYAVRLNYNDGSHRITYGNDLGINNGASCDLAKDKGHTKFMLRIMGIDCPDGEEFLLPWWAEAMSPKHNDSSDFKIKTIDQADEYIKCNFGYPVYCKPVSGSKGNDVFLIQSEEELIETAEQYNQKQIRVAMIEKPIIMPDYRVVVLDGELVSAYQRKPLSVIGNGFNSIRELIEQKQEEFVKQGRDTKLTSEDQRIHSFLKNKGLTLDHIVKEGSDMPLMAVSNLSAGGSSFDVTKSLHNRWSVLAHDISKGFNLRLAGIDLACTDITSPNSNYSILEVNAYPGLRHYASSGAEQAKIVKDFYAKVLNAYPHL